MTNGFYEVALESARTTRRLCGNKESKFNAASDADFAAIAKRRIEDNQQKAASVKSEKAKDKWNAIAKAWIDVLNEGNDDAVDVEITDEASEFAIVTGKQH